MVDFAKAEQDLEWILTALEHPTYLCGKQDSSNVFELSDTTEGYVRHVITELKDKAYKVYRTGWFIGVQK